MYVTVDQGAPLDRRVGGTLVQVIVIDAAAVVFVHLSSLQFFLL
jgi:hypothetical protein